MHHSNSFFMQKALSLATECLDDSDRSPFGSIIVQENRIIGSGKESIAINCDPTAHSEMEAIRDACRQISSASLEGCTLYTSSEPCSMCMSAAYWAKISRVYYSCSRADVYKFGFSDRFNLTQKRTLDLDDQIDLHELMREEGIDVFLQNQKRIDSIRVTKIKS